jgi:hypothetical protein
MADVETQARALGWVPKEDFRGAEDRWVDAETFVRRGEEVMPLLKATNGRLQAEIAELRGENSTIKEALKESSDAIAALKEHQTESTLNAVKETKARLRALIRTARENSDWDALDELEEQLDGIKETQTAIERKVAAPAPTPAPPPAAPKEDPAFVAWKKDNTWFGVDKRRTALMFAISQELREDPANKTLVGLPFYEKAAEMAADVLSERRTPTSKVETNTGSGTPPRSPSDSGKKGYASLPKEAKEACAHQAARLVGPNRAYQKVEDWQKHYAEQYWAYNE